MFKRGGCSNRWFFRRPKRKVQTVFNTIFISGLEANVIRYILHVLLTIYYIQYSHEKLWRGDGWNISAFFFFRTNRARWRCERSNSILLCWEDQLFSIENSKTTNQNSSFPTSKTTSGLWRHWDVVLWRHTYVVVIYGVCRYLEGGTESGFFHVDPTVYVKRLFQVKGKKRIRIEQVKILVQHFIKSIRYVSVYDLVFIYV